MTGSMMNLLRGNSKPLEPEIGMGVTYLGWTDRHPYTVIKVISPTRIVIQADSYKRVDKNGQSESQQYLFTPNPKGEVITLSKRKDGRWREVGKDLRSSIYQIGERSKYHDYSF